MPSVTMRLFLLGSGKVQRGQAESGINNSSEVPMNSSATASAVLEWLDLVETALPKLAPQGLDRLSVDPWIRPMHPDAVAFIALRARDALPRAAFAGAYPEDAAAAPAQNTASFLRWLGFVLTDYERQIEGISDYTNCPVGYPDFAVIFRDLNFDVIAWNNALNTQYKAAATSAPSAHDAAPAKPTKPHAVRFTFDVIVMATDEADARQVAYNAQNDILHDMMFNSGLVISEGVAVETVKDLELYGYDGHCLPYGDKHERPLKDILAE